ncbi:MAG: hypothetical protein M3457_14105 [Chloroflexota bacterium]|nr:hypothetical protein [Chloroflexota bacterium]
MSSPEHERRAIIDYFHSQCFDGVEVMEAEKVTTERVMGRRHQIWNVLATDRRWWVITDPTNLYSQEQFPMMEDVLNFHHGLTARVFSRDRPQIEGDDQGNVSGAWRRWMQAANALNDAEEAEDFQAVGMRCRESLLSFIRDVGTTDMVPQGQSAPQRANFVAWSELIANAIAGGPRSDKARGHIKAVARTSWECVGWLTHSANATRWDAEFVLWATNSTLVAFNGAMIRHGRESPHRCLNCGSYQLASDYRWDGEVMTVVVVCGSCDWEDVPVEA